MTSEKTALLDVNVLLALSWPNHLHHTTARDWFAAHEASWATCPITESAFVRISCHPRIGPEPRTPAEAIGWLRAMRQHPGHRFFPDDVSFSATTEVPRERVIGHRQVTDAHLLAIARRNDALLVTFDRGLESLLDRGEPRLLLLTRPN